MTGDIKLAAPCGIYCGDCHFLGDKCSGCTDVQGKPFYLEQFGMEVCQMYDCSVNRKGQEHCGYCDELPCETFLSTRDPAFTDEEFEAQLKQRQADLLRRKEIGTEAWLIER